MFTVIDDLNQANFKSVQVDFLSYKNQASTGMVDVLTFTFLEELLCVHLSIHTLAYTQYWYSKNIRGLQDEKCKQCSEPVILFSLFYSCITIM